MVGRNIRKSTTVNAAGVAVVVGIHLYFFNYFFLYRYAHGSQWSNKNEN